MPKFDLLIGSEAFWAAASRDVASAKDSVLVQAMTFEGDSAGLRVARAVEASQARVRKVIVDDYTRHVINDTFLARARDPALLREAEATWTMFEQLQRAGTAVRVSNPIGRNPLAYPLRNHKKLLVMDDTAWLGGINFSDHNFAWHDLMLRIADREIASWLAEQFELDWSGRPMTSYRAFADGTEILSLDGVTNRKSFGALLSLFAQARDSVEVISAYPTFPFVDALSSAARRGADVIVYTPRPNNKPIVRDYLLGAGRSSGLQVRLLPMMTHVKAALIDKKALVLGSSNFDFVSFRTSNEYVITIRDTDLIDDAMTRLFKPAQAGAVFPEAKASSRWREGRARLGLRLADSVIGRLQHGARICAWQRP